MKSLRVWLASKILGEHGEIVESPWTRMPKLPSKSYAPMAHEHPHDPFAEAEARVRGYWPAWTPNDELKGRLYDQTSVWTNSDQ